MHKIVEPKIFYFGTPVVMLGISNRSQTVQNILRERELQSTAGV